MSIWIYADDRMRILATNPNDMEGNTGWYPAEDTSGLAAEELYDARQAPRYKYENGQIAQRSEEERKADWPSPEPQALSVAERVEALEQSLDLILSGEVE